MNVKERMQAVIDAEAAAIKAIRITDAFEQAVLLLKSCRGKQAVNGWNGAAHLGSEAAPSISDHCRYGQESAAEQVLQIVLEPQTQPLALVPVFQPLDAVADFADGQHAQELLLEGERT